MNPSRRWTAYMLAEAHERTLQRQEAEFDSQITARELGLDEASELPRTDCDKVTDVSLLLD